MKKLFFAFSIIALISLSSCGAQENCRGRGNVNYQIEQSQTAPALVMNEAVTSIK